MSFFIRVPLLVVEKKYLTSNLRKDIDAGDEYQVPGTKKKEILATSRQDIPAESLDDFDRQVVRIVQMMERVY